MIIKPGIVCVLLCVFAGCVAQAAPVVEVRVAVGKVSEVAFPEKVAKVIKGGPADSVLIEVLDNSIYILPKTTALADIFVAGVTGKSYPLHLVVAAEHDVRVQVQGASINRVASEIKIDALSLMREVMQGNELPGATMLKTQQTVFLNEEQIRLTTEKVYDFSHMAAYVFKAQNLVSERVVVPIQQIVLPHILAAASDDDSLSPAGQAGDNTTIYVITGK